MTESNWLMAQLEAAQKEFDAWPQWKQEAAMLAVDIWSGKNTVQSAVLSDQRES